MPAHALHLSGHGNPGLTLLTREAAMGHTSHAVA